MSNKAVLTTERDFDEDGIGVEIKWHGGRDSVKAFLTYCRLKNYTSPDQEIVLDSCIGYARLIQVLSNFMGDNVNVLVGPIRELDCDNGDNGVYFIGKDWEIRGREYVMSEEQTDYRLEDLLELIDDSQPIPLGRPELLKRLETLKEQGGLDR